jgi:hypothetical protein
MCKAGGIYLNHQKIIDPDYQITSADLDHYQGILFLRLGKTSFKVVNVI